jgi:Fe-S-cluster containining protein
LSQDIEKRFAFPWYSEGLNFSCTQCGKCCTGSPGFVWITEEEMTEMAQFLDLTISMFKRLYVRRSGKRYALIEKKSENHNCVFYQNKKCQIYKVRPLQCRSYPFWQENLLSEQNWKHTAQECEGIHPESPLISYETIEQFLEEQRKQGPEEHFVINP